MLCVICKKASAKVHVTRIVGKKTEKIDLCEYCAQQMAVNDPTRCSVIEMPETRTPKGK